MSSTNLTSMYYDSSDTGMELTTTKLHSKPLLEWTNDDVCAWVNGVEDEILNTSQISEQFRKHNITGSSIQYLSTELLLEIGIKKLQTRLVLKKHIDQLLLQNSLINKDLDDELKIDSNSLITTISLLESLMRNIRLKNNNDYVRLSDQFHELREDLLPVFKWIKEHKPLPTPEISKFSNSYLNSQPNSASSPTKSSSRTSQTTSPIISEQNLTSPLTSQFPLNSSSSSNNLSRLASSRRKSILSPNERSNFSPTIAGLQSPTKSSSTLTTPALASSSSAINTTTTNSQTTLPTTFSTSNTQSTSTIRPQLPHTSSQQSVTRPQLTSSGSSEPLKQLRAKTDDPCYKILQHAMRRHGIANDDWRKYALVICYGDQERVLELNEKPVVVFRELQEEGQHPAIMLRQIDYNDDDETINTTPGGRI